MTKYRWVVLGLAVTIMVNTRFAGADDWPQWRGPDREAVSTETCLLKAWPEEGPPLAWEMRGLGRGYSSLAIVGDTLFTMGDLKEGEEKAQGFFGMCAASCNYWIFNVWDFKKFYWE